jgi:hypothetical protein
MKTKATTKPAPPREIKGNLLEVLGILNTLGRVEIMVSGLENPIGLNENVRASAFAHEETPTRYELSHRGTHIGMAYLRGAA